MRKSLSEFAAWRWVVYLALLPLMVLHEACRGVRTGLDLWNVLVDQHEAAWRRRKNALLVAPLIAGIKPLPANQAKTIKFRRYSLPTA
jgi:hypothetical protein